MAGEDVRDIIAIGGSAGAIEAVSTIVRALPPTLPAAVAVVVHHYQRAPNIFGKILDSLQTLPATTVEDEAPLEHGRIYVPSSDRHLTIAPGSLHAIRTAKENRARPAIDPLFRSAAKAYGRRVVGVVLTGNLDDGAAGLMAIKRAGGLAVVQDPADAMFSGMPRNALEMVEVDFRVRLVEIAALLTTAAEGKMASKRPAAGNGQPPAGPGDLMVFTKVEALIPKWREMMGSPNIWKNLETVALGIPDSRHRLDTIKARIKAITAARAAAAQK